MLNIIATLLSLANMMKYLLNIYCKTLFSYKTIYFSTVLLQVTVGYQGYQGSRCSNEQCM